jgi:exodeoxyribonuclease VII small subunit
MMGSQARMIAGVDYHGKLSETSMSSPPPGKLPADLTFEKALEELERLVARMEDGKLALEESLAAYQRGAELIKFCEAKLSDAQARIAILDGGELRDFTPDK